jgi:2,3-bisphosphoglycerate-independent phosphoglycerate mutase
LIVKHILLIFLDGIGLGADDAASNPFAVANTPTLLNLTSGNRWVKGIGTHHGERALLIPTDPRMGIAGRPQSASGQAAILTGKNVPQLIGEHYGPRPNPAIRAILSADNMFKQVVARGGTAALLEGYPQQFHDSINSGKRLRSSYQEAAHQADLRLFTHDDVQEGRALSVDWTGEAWRSQLGYLNAPLYTPQQAGQRMVEISRQYTFSFFPHWLTDTIGHRGSVADGVKLLETFDGVMLGALAAWNDDEGLLIITSDHGNMEDQSMGKHTENDVPTVIIGTGREQFTTRLRTLADLTPLMLDFLYPHEDETHNS